MLVGLQYWTTCTITNGVELTPENVGRYVEWTSVLKDLETGEVHRINNNSGIYDGDRVAESVDVQGWLYAEFCNCTLNGKPRAFTGQPKAFFTLAGDHPEEEK